MGFGVWGLGFGVWGLGTASRACPKAETLNPPTPGLRVFLLFGCCPGPRALSSIRFAEFSLASCPKVRGGFHRVKHLGKGSGETNYPTTGP